MFKRASPRARVWVCERFDENHDCDSRFCLADKAQDTTCRSLSVKLVD